MGEGEILSFLWRTNVYVEKVNYEIKLRIKFPFEIKSHKLRSLDNNGDSDIQQLLTPLKRLKTNTDTKDDVSEISTSTDRTKANTKSTFIVKVNNRYESISINDDCLIGF